MTLVTRSHSRATLALACLAQLMVTLDLSVVNVALPAIRNGLHFSADDLQWVVNAYTITFAGFLLLGGRAADLLGRRRTFVAGLTLFWLASLAGGLAASEGILITARALQGLGGAIVAPASLSIITTTFEEGPQRNRALGVWGAMAGAGGATGVLLGGTLTDLLSWRWILFITVPIGILVAALTVVYIEESRDPAGSRGFDVAGALAVTLGVSVLVLAIVRTSVAGWASAQTWELVATGVALLSAFVVIEARVAKAPLMPLRILASRTLSAANSVVLLLGAATLGLWYLASLYLQQVLGYSPVETGLAFLPMALCISAGSALASKLVARFGAKTVVVAGMLIEAAGMLLFTRISADGGYLSSFVAPSLIVSVGISLTYVPATIAATSDVAREQAGLASGITNTARLVGGAIGLATLVAFASSRTSTRLARAVPGPHVMAQALTSGFRLAFVIAAGFALVGAATAVVGLPPMERRTTARHRRPSGWSEAGLRP